MTTESGPDLGITAATPVEGCLRLDAVRKFGSAGRSGLQDGDVLVSFDGAAATSLDQLSTLIEKRAVGDVVNATYRRNGAQANVSIKLRAGKKALNLDIEEMEEVLERKISP
jgi:S1-C subfamily serine protease